MRKCPPGNSTSLNLILQLIISQHSLDWRIHWLHNLNISLIACCKTNVRREIYNSIIFFVVPSYTKTQIKWNLFCYHVSLFSVQGTGVLPNHFFRKAIFYQLTHFSLQTNYHRNRSLCILGNNMTNAKSISDYLFCFLIQMQNASEQISADFSSRKQTYHSPFTHTHKKKLSHCTEMRRLLPLAILSPDAVPWVAGSFWRLHKLLACSLQWCSSTALNTTLLWFCFDPQQT